MRVPQRGRDHPTHLPRPPGSPLPSSGSRTPLPGPRPQSLGPALRRSPGPASRAQTPPPLQRPAPPRDPASRSPSPAPAPSELRGWAGRCRGRGFLALSGRCERSRSGLGGRKRRGLSRTAAAAALPCSPPRSRRPRRHGQVGPGGPALDRGGAGGRHQREQLALVRPGGGRAGEAAPGLFAPEPRGGTMGTPCKSPAPRALRGGRPGLSGRFPGRGDPAVGRDLHRCRGFPLRSPSCFKSGSSLASGSGRAQSLEPWDLACTGSGTSLSSFWKLGWTPGMTSGLSLQLGQSMTLRASLLFPHSTSNPLDVSGS